MISPNKDLYLGAFLLTVSIASIIVSAKPELWLISLPIFISGLDLVLRSAKAVMKELPAVALGCIIYTIFYINYNYISSVWMGIRTMSQILSGIEGRFLGTSLNIGPTISGSLIILAFLSCLLAFFILSKKDDPKRFIGLIIIAIAAMIIASAGYILILSTHQIAEAKVMDNLYLALSVFLILFIVVIQKFTLKDIPAGKPLERKTDIALLSAFFLLILVISIYPDIYSGSPGNVVIYERNTEIDFDIPQFPKENESFEPYRGFSIGALGLFLKSIGYNVEDLNDANPRTLEQALEDSDILVLLNLKKPFTAEEAENIRNFVKSGGALFVLGEHTRMFVDKDDFESGRDYLNEVLWPAGIRINPDTADYVRNHWKYANLPLPHYATRNLGLEVSTSSVGASLSLNGSAHPLIIGRYAFSDNPNPKAPGHLGNRTCERGEELGDLVLGACGSYGEGKVLVIGDTSYMFNTEIPFRYKFIKDAVSWMMSEKSDSLSLLRLVLLMLLGIIFVLYLTGKWVLPRYSIALQASISIIVALSIVSSGAIGGYLIDVQENRTDKINLAFIDQSHLNRFNSENHNPDSIDGLIVNIMRNGYMPLVIKEKEDISGISLNDILVVIAPAKSYDSKEVTLINDFVKKGGLLIVSSGYSNAAPLENLLKSFGMYINGTPLGAAPWIVETHGTGGAAVVTPENLKKFWHEPKFMEAHPVGSTSDYMPIAWLNYEGDEYNLIIAENYGAGQVVLVGDSHFLLNENLEYLTTGQGKDEREQYQLQWLGNIELLREIIAKHKGAKE